MRIDAHQHFWRYNAAEYGWIDESMQSLRRDFLPQDLKRELDLAGFDGAIAVQARQTLDETRWLLQLAETSSFIVGVVGWVDLRSLDVRSQIAEFASNPKFLGVRHIVQSEPDDRFLLRPELLRGVAFLEEFNLTYDVPIYPPHLPVAAEFVHASALCARSLGEATDQEPKSPPLAGKHLRTREASEPVLQVIGARNRGRLERLEAFRHPALSRHSLRMLWTGTAHDRIGLASVHSGGLIWAGDEYCGRVPDSISGIRTRRSTRWERRKALAIAPAETAARSFSRS
jgi:hypothetical protein